MAPVLWLVMTLILALPSWAGSTAADLSRTLKLDEIVGILHAEGMDYAASIERDMLPGRGGQLWDRTVEHLYDQGTMRTGLEAALARDMEHEQIAAAEAFFGTEQGQSILTLENAARAAMADSDIEEVARAAYADAREAGDDRIEMIDRFVSANDLVERNVAGALSSNFQFFRGLVDGGAMTMSEQDIIADVWSQETEIRTDTEEWLYAFLMMAYQPLSDDTMQAYIAFSETSAGRALNGALFDGFEAVYRDISYGLGLATAQAMLSSDL